jgi:uncharacterized protein YdhG (YjbR/CyaY superfamily)
MIIATPDHLPAIRAFMAAHRLADVTIVEGAGGSRTDQGSRSAITLVAPSLSTDGREDVDPGTRRRSPRMPAKNAKAGSAGFSAEERAAMKARAEELRAEGKKGAKKADDLQAVLDKIAEMAPDDRALAERVHMTVTAAAPELSPKTWYGMPAYTNADGKLVVAFKNSGKFNTRYSTLEFQDAANLDDREMWPVSYALTTWSPAVEKKVAELVRAAIS